MTSEPSYEGLPQLEEEAAAQLRAAATLDELRQAESAVFGRSGRLAGLQSGLGRLPAEERKEAGRALNAVRARLEEVLSETRAAREAEERGRRLVADALDLTEVLPARPQGRQHPVTQARDRLEDTFIGMGFVVAEGPEVETDWHNFEALNIPPAHPARASHDTLYLDWGEPESTLVRTHTSPVQIRVMLSQPPPIYAVMPGRVYRKDTPDPRHLPGFSQIEGLVVDRGITFADLAGTIETFTHAYFGPDIRSRLRPSYFPFTEPSAEFEITCPICHGSGCRTCSDTGWLELGGCGMVHPNVFRAVDIDPEEWSGFAFGFGIDRLLQVFHAVPDMRILLDNDLRFLSQF